MITQEQILEILKDQKIDFRPKYRRSICSKCFKPGNKFWHIWLNKGGWKKEIHICKSCGEEYGMKV